MQQAARLPPFSTAAVGTPEAEWLGLLASRGHWEPKTRALLVVSPHPDDEVLAAGGLVHAWAAAGKPVTVVSVTDGEAAFPQWRGLDRVRRGELAAALRTLSVAHVSVLRLGIPDGQVARYANRLRNALLAAVDASVTLIAPYERDGHPDHEAVGEVCCRLARAHAIDIARYPVWTWHHTRAAALSTQRWGKFPLSSEARRAKARAVHCFASQLRPPIGMPVVPSHVLSYFERPFEAFLL